MIKPIPLAVLKPLAAGPYKADAEWSLIQFATALEWHRERDARSGLTCKYAVSAEGSSGNMLNSTELKAIITADAIDPEFYCSTGDRYGVNQHWLHSLMQFYAECTKAWEEHEARTQALIGTPAGRIKR